MVTWFEIIEAKITEGRIYLKGHWMVGEDEETAVPRNVHTQPILLEPMMPREAVACEVEIQAEEKQAQKGELPLSKEEKEEILASVEKSNPVYIALENLMKAAANALHAEMGVEVRVRT